jgi:uncharacterized protein
MVNGGHTESLSPAIFVRWLEFLELYVAKRTPQIGAAALIAPILTPGLYGVSVPVSETDRLANLDYDEALATFEADPRVRILFEQGAADGTEPRVPLPRFEAGFDAWPVPEAEAVRWYLTPDGQLAGAAPATAGEGDPTSWTNDPDAVPDVTFAGDNRNDIWRADVELDWQALRRAPAPPGPRPP